MRQKYEAFLKEQQECFEEIAKELGKNLNTIKVQLFRIKQKLGVKDCRGIIKHLQLMNF